MILVSLVCPCSPNIHVQVSIPYNIQCYLQFKTLSFKNSFQFYHRPSAVLLLYIQYIHPWVLIKTIFNLDHIFLAERVISKYRDHYTMQYFSAWKYPLSSGERPNCLQITLYFILSELLPIRKQADSLFIRDATNTTTFTCIMHFFNLTQAAKLFTFYFFFQ